MSDLSGLNNSANKFFTGAFYLFVLSAPFSIALTQLFAAAVIVVGFWLLFTYAPRECISVWAWLFPVLFMVIVLISVAASGHAAAAIPQMSKTWVLLCLFPALFFSRLLEPRKIIDFLFWGTVLASAIGLGRYAIGAVDRAAPFSGGYTTMALFEAAALPLALGEIVRYHGKTRRLYLAGAIIVGLGLIFSGTRAGWLAALVGLLLAGLGIGRKATLYAFLAAVIVIAVIPGTRRIVVHRLEKSARGDYTSGRSHLWQSAMEVIPGMPPWGYGPGSFHRLMPELRLKQIGDLKISSWHSTPLEILIESGPLALMAFLAAACYFLVEAWRRHIRNGRGTSGRIAMFAALISFYVAGMTTNIMRDFLLSSLLVILWVLPRLGEKGIFSESDVLGNG